LSEQFLVQKEAERWMHLQRVHVKCFCYTFKVCPACKFPLEAQSVFGVQNDYLAGDESCLSAFCTTATSWRSWRRKREGRGEKNPQKLDTRIGQLIKEDHWGGK